MVDLERVVNKTSPIFVVRGATCGGVVALAKVCYHAVHTSAVDGLENLDDALHRFVALVASTNIRK